MVWTMLPSIGPGINTMTSLEQPVHGHGVHSMATPGHSTVGRV